MAESPSGQQVFPHRQELKKWIRCKAPSLADGYEGAILMLEDRAFPGRLHFIAHAVRDICDRLIFVLDPQEPPKRVDYEGALDKIQEHWPGLDSLMNHIDLPPSDLPVSRQVAERIDKLVASHRARRQKPSNQDLLFRFLMRSTPSQGSVYEKLARDFKNTRNWFMHHAHFREKYLQELSEWDLRAKFTEFERMLFFFIDNFFKGKNELDQILHDANG